MSLFLFLGFQKTFDMVPCDNLQEDLKYLVAPLHLQVVKVIYTTFYAKAMFDIDITQGCPLSCTLYGLYIDIIIAYLDKIERVLCIYLLW